MMTELLTKDGALVCISSVDARVYGPDSGMQGRIAHASVAINFGSHCGLGRFSVHVSPDEALLIAHMLLEHARLAQASEMALMGRLDLEAA